MKFTLFLLTIAISVLFISCEDNNTDPKITKNLGFEDNTPAGRSFVSEGLVIDDVISMTIPVKNTGNSSINLKAKIEVVENIGGLEANLCLGNSNCISLKDGFKEISNSVSLAAGSTATEDVIKLYIAPNQKKGIFVANITLWDANNPDDVVTVSASLKSNELSLVLTMIPSDKAGSSNATEISASLNFKNSGDKPITLAAGIRSPNLSFGHETAICWGDPLAGGVCYAPVTEDFDTPDFYTLQPGQESGPGSFIAYLYPNGNMGNSKVTYVIYNVNNPKEIVSFDVNYTISF